MSRGRPLRVPWEELAEIIRHNMDCFLNEDTYDLQPFSMPIWQRISDAVKGKKSAKTIYRDLQLNRGNLLQRVGKICTRKSPVDVDEETVYSKSSNGNLESNGSTVGTNDMKFSFHISYDDWQNKIMPVKKFGKGRGGKLRYWWTLKSGWTAVIFEQFWKATYAVCPIGFSKATVHPGGECYLRIVARCNTCNSSFTGVVTHEPLDDEDILFHCEYKGNFRDCNSNKSRRLTQDMKEYFLHQMRDLKLPPSKVRNWFADEKMTFGDIAPALIPSANALRVLKLKDKNKESGVKDVILGVFNLKCKKFQASIRDIGYHRLFIHYWTSAEINIYREYCRRNKRCPTICIDATGGLVKRPTYFGAMDCGPIYYYQIACYDGPSKSQFSAAHMLSERYDNNSISHWLEQWLRMNIPHPKQVVTDMSLALLGAVAKTFTPYETLWTYIDICDHILRGAGENTQGMPCLIRCDVAHVIKIICGWKEIPVTPGDNRLKQFICRSMAQMLLSRSLEDVENLLRNLLRVLRSPTNGDNEETKEPTVAEKAIKYLKNRGGSGRSGFQLDEFVYNINQRKLDGDSCENDSVWNKRLIQLNLVSKCKRTSRLIRNPFYIAAVQIDTEVQAEIKNETGVGDNHFYLPTVISSIFRLYQYVPLWSGIMCDIVEFGDVPASSAPVESNFNIIKNTFFPKKCSLPVRLDEFVNTHLTELSGFEKLTFSRLIRDRTLAAPVVEPVLSDSDVEIEIPIPDIDKTSPVNGKRKRMDSSVQRIRVDQRIRDKFINDVNTKQSPGNSAKKKRNIDTNIPSDIKTSKKIDSRIRDRVSKPSFYHPSVEQFPLHYPSTKQVESVINEEGAHDYHVVSSEAQDEVITVDVEGDTSAELEEGVCTTCNKTIVTDHKCSNCSSIVHRILPCSHPYKVNVDEPRLCLKCYTDHTCKFCWYDNNIDIDPDLDLSCVICGAFIHFSKPCSYPCKHNEDSYNDPRWCQKCYKQKQKELRPQQDESVNLEQNRQQQDESVNLEQNQPQQDEPVIEDIWKKTRQEQATQAIFDESRATEIWKRKQKSIARYMEASAEYIQQRHDKRTTSKIIGHLRNGNSTDLQAVKINTHSYLLRNTCPFDSLSQIMAVAYCDSAEYREMVLIAPTQFLIFISKLVTVGVNNSMYTERGKILLSTGPRISYSTGVREMNTEYVIDHLVKKLFSENGSAYIECMYCRMDIESIIVFEIIYDPPDEYTENIITGYMMQAILAWSDHHQTRKCTEDQCKGKQVNNQVRFLDQLFFSVLCWRTPICTQQLGSVSPYMLVKLSDIPRNFTINGNNYTLRGVVTVPLHQYQVESRDPLVVGHYIACCYREMNQVWEEHDDQHNKSTYLKSDTIVAVELIVYTK